MTIAYWERRILRSAAEAQADSLPTVDEPIRDEHSRPIDVLVGFVVDDLDIETLTDNDLDQIWPQALSVYSEFLMDEEEFETRSSAPVRLDSAVSSFADEQAPPVYPTAHPDPAVSSAPDWPQPRRPRPAPAAVGAVLLVLMVVMAFAVFRIVSGVFGGERSLRVDAASSECETLAVAAGERCDLVVSWHGAEAAFVKAFLEPDNPARGWDLKTECADRPLQPGESCILTVVVGEPLDREGNPSWLRVQAGPDDESRSIQLPRLE